MQILTGKEVAEKVYETLQSDCNAFVEKYGFPPTLAVVLVGNDPASQSYVQGKKQACLSLGFGHRDYHLAQTTSQKELLDLIHELNEDKTVHGILVQMPLPAHLDADTVIQNIKVEKDVDGFHPQNVGNLLIGKHGFVSCTPLGVLQILDYYGIPVEGKHVVVLGRSNIVGKPMASLLMQKGRDATVTVCHSKTENLTSITVQADILIAAIGKPLFVTESMVKEGCIVIDVGINRVEDASRKRGYRLVGDVDYEHVSPHCKAITPVPGGVGVMTIAMLMKNTMQAALQLAQKETQ
ncbi:bifunctional methylenetetrahydrofolate dehydrogenase/methenyltetrahydrofolate cyclohydrolase FolD [Sphaerochaeta globosa]|uniref:Bifunctional protein FolD n=1 Tax=Sphaerochaeta globosa (strain ATCC BAA-1886 / DSM 22777 / Buddy) TaxID=158189 RepID=F0RZ36_SPHGB|nr:bifunctional methylenetetrahydrofolate dehydrogenase/methenyltetrahydrofolate cyclohydrolase FolD [Sphaerochaeta globosa]ADY13243.1 Bifunctional protein folD [Sphaerochaeta globosa str. Buddy]